MAKALRIVQVLPGTGGKNQRADIGIISGEEMSLGREPGKDGLAIPSQAVSRRHGLFTAVRNHWFFRDLGSTNGSWLNGQKLEPDQWQLVKAGDVLQLGDAALEISYAPSSGGFGSGGPPIGIRSLLIFSRVAFLDEYPIPEYGRALVIGGSKADLKLDIDVHELPALVIERRGDSVCAFSISKEIPVFCNGKELTHTVTLRDRDQVKVDHYIVVFNDISVANSADVSMQAAQVNSSYTSEETLRGKPTLEYQAHNADTPSAEMPMMEDASDSATRPSKSYPWAEVGDAEAADYRTSAAARFTDKSVFGRVKDTDAIGADETIAMDGSSVRTTIAGYDVHPGMRQAAFEPAESPLNSLEDKIWLIVGLLMVVALIGLVVWWMLR